MTERGPGLAVRDLGFAWPKGQQLFDGLCLDLPGGGVTALVGASGSGKSTFLRLLAGFETPASGEVAWDGQQPASIRRQRLLGWMPQIPALFPWKSVADNVRVVVPGISSDAIRAALAEVELEHVAQAYPYQLSLGMQQRVALARALAGQPRVLLLDEPFAALDALLREEMQDVLRRLLERRPVTAVLVTHSVEEAVGLAREVVVLAGRPVRVAGRIQAGEAGAAGRVRSLLRLGRAAA